MAARRPTRVVHALRGLSKVEARKAALQASVEYTRARMRERALLRGAALQSAVDRARQLLRRLVALAFDAQLSVDASAYLLEAATSTLRADASAFTEDTLH